MFSYPTSVSLCLPKIRVAGINGLGGSFRLEWVAALPWNQWQLWSGICKEYHRY
ncbi:hypothetical protein [Nitrosomonas ureae]|uniref:hypothetical protein n=1 Tax=Nitrosomonas ureae TaxID=44577 RepID=UPI0015E1D92C|nr:hypothetical protein [Nitrosomonas ureae]